MKSIRWNTTAELAKREYGTNQCTCCDRKLVGAVRMLEHDQRDSTYHDFRDVPEDRSQGWFPFGLGCAATKIKEALAKKNSASTMSSQQHSGGADG